MPDSLTASPNIIAVCGKGGVGKTSISASLVKILAEDASKKILAIDADPAVGLATALGFAPRKTVDDIRNRLIGAIEAKSAGDKNAIIKLIDYELLDALEERGNLAFLAIGRPETEGCYCQVNDFLRDVIESAANGFDWVIIDGEAGIEQVNRRVMERVTHLLLVSDASMKGINVAKTIHAVSAGTVPFDTAGFIINRLRDKGELASVALPEGIPFLGWVPEDNAIRACDISGGSIMDLTSTPAIEAIRVCLTSLVAADSSRP